MGAIAGINDIGRNATGEIHAGPGRGMAHHHHIYLHGQNVIHGVEQGLTLAHAAAAGGEVYDVGTEAAFGQFEGDAGAGAAFKEEIGHGNITQAGDFFNGPVDDLLEIVRRLEKELNVVFGDIFDADQVAGGEAFHASGRG